MLSSARQFIQDLCYNPFGEQCIGDTFNAIMQTKSSLGIKLSVNTVSFAIRFPALLLEFTPHIICGLDFVTC